MLAKGRKVKTGCITCKFVFVSLMTVLIAMLHLSRLTQIHAESEESNATRKSPFVPGVSVQAGPVMGTRMK